MKVAKHVFGIGTSVISGRPIRLLLFILLLQLLFTASSYAYEPFPDTNIKLKLDTPKNVNLLPGNPTAIKGYFSWDATTSQSMGSFLILYVKVSFNDLNFDTSGITMTAGCFPMKISERGPGYIVYSMWAFNPVNPPDPNAVAFTMNILVQAAKTVTISQQALYYNGALTGMGGHRWGTIPVTFEYQTPPIGQTLGCLTGRCDPVIARTSGGSTIDYASGNLNIDVDVTRIIPNTALPTNLTLYYNSLDDIITGPLGPNWTHTFNQQIITNTDGSLVYRMYDGQRFSYTPTDTAGLFLPLPQYGDYSYLVTTTGGYVLTMKDSTRYVFRLDGKLSAIQGRCYSLNCGYDEFNNLESISLPYGQSIALEYTDGRLITVTDTASNQASLSYYPTGQLESVSQNSGVWKWQFEYRDDTNLISVATNPNIIQTEYKYEPETNKISSIIDANSNALTFSYDTVTSVVTSTDRTGKTTTVKYDLASDTWSEMKDMSGNIIINDINYSNRNLRSRTKPNGAITRYTYDYRGNVLTITDPLLNTTTYAYTDTANSDLPTLITDALGVSTSLKYDGKGNLIKKIEALGTSVEQRTDYEYYDNSCKIKKETRDPGPDGLNLTTNYYYTDGYLTFKIVDENGISITYRTDYTNLGQVWKTYCPRSMQPNFEYTYDYRGNRKTIRTYTSPGISYLTTLEYDRSDHLIKRTEDDGELNLVTEYGYDNLGRPISTTLDPAGLNIQTWNEYDNAGRITRTVDAEGAITEYEYWSNGWLKMRTLEPLTLNLSTLYEYDLNGNLTRSTDPEGHITIYTYTLRDQVETVTDPEGNVTRYGYNEVGLNIWTQDARGNTTYNYYDELRHLTHTRTPQDNITMAYAYDKAGRTVQVIGPWYDANQNGDADDADSANVRHSEYDRADRVIRSWVNSHPATLYGYDNNGNVTRVTDPEGTVTEHQYSRCGHLTLTKVDPTGLNEQTKYIYDKVGRQIEVHSAFGTPLETVSYSVYDNANRLITQYTNNPTYATNYTYNKRGQQTQVIDAEGHSTLSAYDLAGRLIRTTDARGSNTDYEYNKDGLRTKLTYYKNGTPIDTNYTYYSNHLLKTTDLPGYNGLRNITTNVYDGNGNLTSKTDAKGQTIVYTYDLNNRLTGKTCNGQNTSYTFNATGNLLTTLDANTNTENTYDDLNRLTGTTDKTYTPAKLIQYSYYEDGTRKTMLEPEGALVEYSYDKAKRLLTIKRNSVVEGTYQYNALGLRTKLTNGSNSYTEYEYNHPLRWLTALYNKKSDGSIISSFVYTLDKVGNRNTMSLSNGDTITYGYDNAYQLISEVRTGSASYQLAWTYDEVGNRLTQSKNGVLTTYTCNDANQLVSEVTGSEVSAYEYDANGNQVKKTKGIEVSQWSYDYENKQITYSDSLNSGTYVYNAMGQRIKKTAVMTVFKSGGAQNASEKIGIGNGKGKGREQGQGTQNALGNTTEVITTTEQYLYDGANIIADYNGSNVLQARYLTPFLDDNVLVMRGTDKFYYMKDGLASVRQLIDAGQVTQNAYDYYAFGEILSETEAVPQRYKFTSREWDAESQTNYFRARTQDPRIGRFLSADPIEYDGGMNLYSYVGNNPVNWVDPSGFQMEAESSAPSTTTTDKKCEDKHVMLEAKKYYCCCVTDLSLKNEFSFSEGPYVVGNFFSLNVGIKYISCYTEQVKYDCFLSWLEKSSDPSPAKRRAGIEPGKWGEMMDYPQFRNSPGLAGWNNKTRPGPTPPGEISPIWDRPTHDIRRGPKTLQIIISVMSAPECPCETTKKSIGLTQSITKDGQSTITTDFQY